MLPPFGRVAGKSRTTKWFHDCSSFRVKFNPCLFFLFDDRFLTGIQIFFNVSSYFSSATEHDPTWYKAWHAFAFMNFEAVYFYTSHPNKALEQKGGGLVSIGLKNKIPL